MHNFVDENNQIITQTPKELQLLSFDFFRIFTPIFLLKNFLKLNRSFDFPLKKQTLKFFFTIMMENVHPFKNCAIIFFFNCFKMFPSFFGKYTNGTERKYSIGFQRPLPPENSLLRQTPNPSEFCT